MLKSFRALIVIAIATVVTMSTAIAADIRVLAATSLKEALDAQAKAFENGLRTAHVVRIPRATHYVFQSNEADVLREMDAFISGLKER